MLPFLCRLVGHRRSKRWARPTPMGWRSECRRCGEALIRVAPRQWQPLQLHDEQ